MQFGLARRPRRRLRWNSRSPEGWAGPSPEVATWASRSSPWWRPPHRVRTPRRATRTAPPGGSSRRSTRSSLRVGSVRCRPLLAVAHTAGLPSPQLRLLDRLLTAARQQGGRASMSQDWIGIGSAMADPDATCTPSGPPAGSLWSTLPNRVNGTATTDLPALLHQALPHPHPRGVVAGSRGSWRVTMPSAPDRLAAPAYPC